MKDPPPGMALPLLLLLLLALTALGHGSLILAQRELKTVWAIRSALRANQAAEASMRVGWADDEILSTERVPWTSHLLVSGESPDGLIYRSVLRWLDQEFFLLEGIGGTRGWAGERRRAWVGWSLHPAARLGAFSAGAELGEGLSHPGGGTLDISGFLGAPVDWEAPLCEGYRAVLDSLFPYGSLPPVAPLAPTVLIDSGPGALIPALGLLTGTQLLEEVEAGSSGLRLFQNSVLGCPGEDGPVFHGTEGSMSLMEGRTCGVLVVAGDLRLGGDARVQGLALVGGDLILEDRSVLEGMARVGGSLQLNPMASFQARSCPVLWALEGLPVLQRPHLIPDGAEVNGF